MDRIPRTTLGKGSHLPTAPRPEQSLLGETGAAGHLELAAYSSWSACT